MATVLRLMLLSLLIALSASQLAAARSDGSVLYISFALKGHSYWTAVSKIDK
ncbi:MAG: hypothetical protein M2R45_01503 [Verrucomicrobia subdivision 3 bacterium]|nr:hypothetical protein [Limisphaerales bacterium]MCS1413368.1 hypothetical protein [Limisphaerales bacterium]